VNIAGVSGVPVFITSYGRLDMLGECLRSIIDKPGIGKITVVDNAGRVPEGPFFDVVQADNTHRHLAPWKLGLVPKDRYYIVTDEDCALVEGCPDDFVDNLIAVLENYPEVSKVGLGINTANFLDPPPERYRYSYEMERQVANYPLMAPGIRSAPVDTTFAMYRSPEWPGICGVRLEAPYLIEHLPWLNAEYSDEEKAYYAQEDMTQWARTHSAASEVAPKVLVPFTNLRAETVVALGNSTIAYELLARPVTDDEGYFWALAEEWTPTPEHMAEPFILVEHDIVVRPETLQELRDCPEDWCAAPYPYLDKEEAWGMGCVKFSDRLIVRNPWIFQQFENSCDINHAPRHWCLLDYHIWSMLTQNGEKRHDHAGPALGHLGHPGGGSAHGCL
jgi:hypothetical protein